MKKIDGFTLAEVLVGLSALSFALLLTLQLALILRSFPKENFKNEDIIGVQQLQLIFAEASDISLHDEILEFTYRRQNYQLSFHHQRIVKQPGYEIFLKDIERGHFYEENNCFYAEWFRETASSAILGCR